MAFTIAASILGQVIGSRAERHRLQTVTAGKSVLSESSSTSQLAEVVIGGNCGEIVDWKVNPLQVASS